MRGAALMRAAAFCAALAGAQVAWAQAPSTGASAPVDAAAPSSPSESSGATLPRITTAAEPASAPSLREQMSPEAARRLRTLEEELRCLVCQNQTLADSGADLAVDLRRQVEHMVSEGRSDAEIKNYLVERYGDFVLYRPRIQGNTLALWLGPFVLLLVGVIAWVLVQRRSMRAGAPRAPSAAADHERARKLLDE